MKNLRYTRKRELILPVFWGEPLYRDQLGWQMAEKQEARSYVSKEIFNFEVVLVGLNLAFYYPTNDTYYGLHTEWEPIEFKILPYGCIDTHKAGEVLYSFERREDIWDTIKIDGKSFEEVLNNSVIMCLN